MIFFWFKFWIINFFLIYKNLYIFISYYIIKNLRFLWIFSFLSPLIWRNYFWWLVETFLSFFLFLVSSLFNVKRLFLLAYKDVFWFLLVSLFWLKKAICCWLIKTFLSSSLWFKRLFLSLLLLIIILSSLSLGILS